MERIAFGANVLAQVPRSNPGGLMDALTRLSEHGIGDVSARLVQADEFRRVGTEPIANVVNFTVPDKSHLDAMDIIMGALYKAHETIHTIPLKLGNLIKPRGI